MIATVNDQPEERSKGITMKREDIVQSNVRRKRLQKVQIVSDLQCYGPCPEPDDVIEQRLTVSANGQVWFTEYLYGELGSKKHSVSRQARLSIGKDKSAAILSLVADYCESYSMMIHCTDIGDWKLTATAPDGEKKRISGSLCGGIIVEDIDLTDYIREQISIDNLAVFGGGEDWQ